MRLALRITVSVVWFIIDLCFLFAFFFHLFCKLWETGEHFRKDTHAPGFWFSHRNLYFQIVHHPPEVCHDSLWAGTMMLLSLLFPFSLKLIQLLLEITVYSQCFCVSLWDMKSFQGNPLQWQISVLFVGVVRLASRSQKFLSLCSLFVVVVEHHQTLFPSLSLCTMCPPRPYGEWNNLL